jgi:hypothetical protein
MLNLPGLKALWMERLTEISEGLVQNIETLLGDNFKVQMRYVFNDPRVWFVPTPTYQEGITRPFAEEPRPKDKWVSPSDIMAFTIPTLPDDQIRETPTIIFGAGHRLQEMTEDQKRYARIGKKKATASQKALAVQKPVPEAKASKPVNGQESPETKVSHPMQTRRQASRAGGLRSGGGSGQTDTCVASFNPSKT